MSRLLESGCERTEGYLYLVTLTAPGERQHVDKRTGALCPCTPVGGVDLAMWNTSHSRRWNRFLTGLRHEHAGMQFARGVEVQRRGALHDHAIVWSPKPLSLQRLRARAVAAGFGHSVDLEPLTPGSRRAAAYVSKYVSKSCNDRASVPWLRVDRATGEILGARATFRTWSASRGWGLTMREIRAVCAEQAARAAARRADAPVALLVTQLDAARVDDGQPDP